MIGHSSNQERQSFKVFGHNRNNNRYARDINKDNNGMYTINIKVTNVYDESCCNIIGITLKKYDNNQKKVKNNKLTIAVMIKVIILNDEQLPNRLCCGCGDNDRKNYAFERNNFFYQSTIDNYKNRLLGFKSGEILILSYDKNVNQLSCEKENDNDKLHPLSNIYQNI